MAWTDAAPEWPEEDKITLRDYIAIQAMSSCPINQHFHSDIAEFCYKRADAFLKFKETKNEH